MEKQISASAFIFSAMIALLVLLSASITLPHDRYYRFQAHDNVSTRKADWIYERLHFDDTPVDVALIGTSRMAGGLSGPLIEKTYCAATGRRIHVANLAIPVTGRNMHYVLAREAMQAKKPSLIVLELNEVESRRPHAGFIYLANASDIVTAPALINLRYFSDLVRLPGRQLRLFFETVTGSPAVRTRFDPAQYAGRNLDLTEIMLSVDGRIMSRRIIRAEDEMERLRKARVDDLSPLFILPPALHGLEYRFSRHYLDRIREAAAAHQAAVDYVMTPAFRGGDAPKRLLKELEIARAPINLGADLQADHRLWFDATHLNADGAEIASERFALSLAARHPDLGAEDCSAATR